MMKEKKKVIFLGESIAYGFPYAPHDTSVKYFRDLLRANDMECNVDDQTKVNIRMPELIEHCAQAANENPDYVIVCAGSNWTKRLWNLTKPETHQVYSYIMSGMPWHQGIQNVFQEKAAAQINHFFKQLKKIFTDNNIKILFVLPGFNLKDWHYNCYDTQLNNPAGITKLWKQIINAPISYENAWKMIRLDPANPLGYKTMAEISYKENDMDRAREMYDKALNTNLFRPGSIPAGNDLITDCVMEASRTYGIRVCDMSKVVLEYLKGDIPGNDLFMDDCHFNDKGIRIACEQLARYVLSWQNKELSVIPELTPNPIISSHAHFYAAIHSAHLGNISKDYLLYHLREALNIHQGIADKMMKYCKLASKKTPWHLSEIFIEIDSDQYPAIRKQEDCMAMDVELVDSILIALEETGIDIRDEIHELRMSSHICETPVKINLLESYYKESSYSYVFAGSQSADQDSRKKLHSSFRTQFANFYLILPNTSNVICDVILRVPQALSSDKISLAINGTEIYSGNVSNKWHRIKADIPISLLLAGMNKLTIQWPEIPAIRDNIIFSPGFIMDYIRPVYGDVLRLMVTEETPFCIKLDSNDTVCFSKNMVGNKGYNLLKLCHMGLNVPEGFILPVFICREYYRNNKVISEAIKKTIISGLSELEQSSGRKLDDKNNPLIISIRSGAAVSMPGMLDTILNVGFNEHNCHQTYHFLTYINFIRNYAKIVKNITMKEYNTDGLNIEGFRKVLRRYKQQYQTKTGEPFPKKSVECMINIVEVIFQSWGNSNAVLYRKDKGISDDLFTAVILQRMVVRDKNENSGTGVVFTQNPFTKEKEMFGEYLLSTQGEEPAAGIVNSMPIEQLSRTHPKIHETLQNNAYKIEDDFGVPQVIEFAYEDGNVYILQTRDMPK